MVDVEGAQRNINIGMLDEHPGRGDWILIHMGFAMEVIDAAQAEKAISGLEMMGQAREEPARRLPLEGGTSCLTRDGAHAALRSRGPCCSRGTPSRPTRTATAARLTTTHSSSTVPKAPKAGG